MSNGNGKLEQQWLLQRNSLRAESFVNFEGISCFCFPSIIDSLCFCVSRFFACDRLFQAIIDQFSSKIFLISCCLSSSRPSLFLSSLESSSGGVFADQVGRVRCIVICIKPARSQMTDGTESPFEVCKRALRYNEFGCKQDYII